MVKYVTETGRELGAILRKLDPFIEPKTVAEVVIEPGRVTVMQRALNENGRAYISADGVNPEMLEPREFTVSTLEVNMLTEAEANPPWYKPHWLFHSWSVWAPLPGGGGVTAVAYGVNVNPRDIRSCTVCRKRQVRYA